MAIDKASLSLHAFTELAHHKEPLRLSVDALKKWSRCKRKYQLDVVNNLRWPTDSSNFARGQDVHKLMDYHARGLDCAPLLATASGQVQNDWRLLMAEPITQLPILASEWAFNVPLTVNHQRVWLVGRADRISRDGNAVLVIDWKTGTAVPKNPELDWQTLVYLYATVEARRDLGLPDDLSPDNLRFVYVEVKREIRAVPVAYSASRHAEVRELLTETIGQMLRETEYALPATCPDRWCPYSSVCGILVQD